MALIIPTIDEPFISPAPWVRHFLAVCGPSSFSSAHTAEQVSAAFRGDGQVAVITGCASGLGLESLRVLAKRGCEIFAGVRDPKKLERSLVFIRQSIPKAKITVLPLDLSSLESVRAFAAAFQKTKKNVNILLCNAGIMASPFKLSADGHEMQFATNHLGHFLLVKLLSPQLIAAAAVPGAAESRVVVVASWAHISFSKTPKFKFEDMDSGKGYSPWSAYGVSKVSNILFARELARQMHGKGVSVAALHPGVIMNTDLAQHSMSMVPQFVQDQFKNVVRFSPIFKDINNGAATQVWLCVAPKIDSGAYYQDCNLAPCSAAAKDDVLAKELWAYSEKCCSTKPIAADVPVAVKA